MNNKKRTVEERVNMFWDKVDIKGPNDCWNWKASTDKDGYGQYWIGNTFVRAHRFAFMFNHSCIKEGNLVLHNCDNSRCCNPDHLFEGTVQDNVKDKMTKGRHSYTAHPRYYTGEVWLMRRLYTAKVSTTLIAKMFKGHQSVIWRILHNLSYTPKEGYDEI
jgi:hypothetical protein